VTASKAVVKTAVTRNHDRHCRPRSMTHLGEAMLPYVRANPDH
jgi:hypothetical protein